mmetsp:Transcript_13119/g.40964  ORF Transcript_13119/g.40964 Transcript_13119/m.40964 type:complete len:225 (-) Transcript_13119:159-833(-)
MAGLGRASLPRCGVVGLRRCFRTAGRHQACGLLEAPLQPLRSGGRNLPASLQRHGDPLSGTPRRVRATALPAEHGGFDGPCRAGHLPTSGGVVEPRPCDHRSRRLGRRRPEQRDLQPHDGHGFPRAHRGRRPATHPRRLRAAPLRRVAWRSLRGLRRAVRAGRSPRILPPLEELRGRRLRHRHARVGEHGFRDGPLLGAGSAADAVLGLLQGGSLSHPHSLRLP